MSILHIKSVVYRFIKNRQKLMLGGGIPLLLLLLLFTARWILPCRFTFSCPIDDYDPKLTFEDYCEDGGRDYRAPWKTVQVLLKIARTEDCAAAAETLQSLNALYLENNQLESLAPLSHMTQLIFLNARKNAIADLRPLNQLTNLISLKLEANKVVDIKPLKGLTRLKSLDLSTNPLRDIEALSELRDLQILRLDETNVDDIKPLRKLSKLEVYDYFRGLSLSQTKLETEGFAALGDCSPSSIPSPAVREICQKVAQP